MFKLLSNAGDWNEWWDSHWWQRQAGPGPQGAYVTKSDYLSVFQLITGPQK